MSSKLTELTESHPSVLTPSALCGAGNLSQLFLPWSMSSSGHFAPSQADDGYKEVEVLDPSCTEYFMKGKECFQNFNPKYSKCHFCFVEKKPCHCPGMPDSNVRRYLWSKKDGPFGKAFPVSEAPTPDGTSGYSNCNSEVPISRINTEGVVKRIRQIAASPTNPNAEGSDELDGEESFQSQLVSSTPRNFQPVLSTIPPPSKSPCTARPALVSTVRPSPIPQSINSPIVTSQQLQPVASSSRRREDHSPLLFPAPQVFQKREN
ncbi:hypothetical protein O181_009213 [Austropuccinia psidii MF-1]|uniref:Uncharacterized protein n=1 Tax=Austropuccinia psidii MF-1 TaxID=1389203 RepID=A0A9Q3BQX5_9BASI|nr:hypothetical protein [Austropuccinia psidii MF-1]